MQERKLKAGVESEPILSRQAVERQVEEPAAQGILSPQRDPLAQVTCRAGDVSCASAHASTLNRATDSYPAHAGQSLQQLQRQYGNRYVQRVLALARTDAGEASAAPEVERAIQGARGGGQALDSGVRAQMEPALGADFSGVRVHADAGADALNRSLNARAFTSGRDVFFRQGAYSPGSSSGRELLAHELTHVVQQTGSQPCCKLFLNQPGDKYEEEANLVAQSIKQQEQQGSDKAIINASLNRQPKELESRPAQEKGTRSMISVVQKAEEGGGGGGKENDITEAIREATEAKREAAKAREEAKKARQEVKGLEYKNKLLRDQMTCILMLQQFKDRADQRHKQWMIFARDTGSAYAKAYRKHKKAVTDVGEKRELMQSIAFMILTTAVGGMALGGAAEFLTNRKGSKAAASWMNKHRALVAAIEDGVQTATGEAIDVWQGYVKPKPQPIGNEPQVFQNELQNAVDGCFLGILREIIRVRKTLLGLEEDDLEVMKPDPKTLLQNLDNWWKTEFELRETPTTIGAAKMERAMERNIWAEWMPSLKTVTRIGPPPTSEDRGTLTAMRAILITIEPGTYVSYDSPGGAVEERFDELGITREAGVTGYGWFWTSESEIIKLIEWAKDHKVEMLGLSL